MKKIFMTLSLAAIMAMPSISFAQKPDTDKKTSTCCQTNGKGQCEANCNPECSSECNPACKASDSRKCSKPCIAKGDKKMGKKHKAHKKDRRGELRQSKKRLGMKSDKNMLFQGITLSADQQQKLQALKQQRKDEHKKAKAEQAARKADERQKRSAAYDKELEKILTPDQYKQYQANKEAMKASASQKKHSRR